MKSLPLSKLTIAIGLIASIQMPLAWAEKPTTANLFEQERLELHRATRVYFPSKAMANKASITFHNQLLASFKDDGYLIIALSDEDKIKLKSLGFTLAPATLWIANRNKTIDRQAAEQKKSSQQMLAAETIPGFPCYATVEGTFDTAAGLAEQYPQLAQWQDIGDSWVKQDSNNTAGFDIKVLKITNQATDMTVKPILFIHSAMHAREYATAELTLRFAQLLLNGYGNDADISWILDQHEVHIVFHMNPDGRKMAETGLSWRKNVNESHCGISSENRGVDLNRNFSKFWNTAENGSSSSQCNDTYRGPQPASEPETQAIESYIRSIFADNRGPNDEDAAPADTSGMHIDIHSFSELVLWPWGHRNSAAPNGPELATLGRKLAYFNGYEPQQSIGLYPTDGTSDDVSYGELGVAAYTFELGTHFFQNCSTFDSTILPDNLDALLYAAKVVSAPYITPAGPDVILLRLNDQENLTVPAGTQVKISTRVTDRRYRNSNGTEPTQLIAAAEYTVDKLPWSEGAQPIALQSTDGTLDSESEDMDSQIDTQGWSEGRHTLYLRGKDIAGNWGPVSAIYLTINELVEPPANQPPVANFTFGCSSVNCQFDPASSVDPDGDISSYQWEFGSEESIAGEGQPQAITHSFDAPGDYEVRLTLGDNGGATHSESKVVSVFNQPPTASFSVTCADLSCDLDAAASSDSDGVIVSYQWTIDQLVQSQTDSSLTVEFGEGGTFVATLTVTDNWAGTHATTKMIEVVAATTPAPPAPPAPTPTPDPVPPVSDAGNGGGGSFGFIGGLLLLLGLRRRRYHHGENGW